VDSSIGCGNLDVSLRDILPRQTSKAGAWEED